MRIYYCLSLGSSNCNSQYTNICTRQKTCMHCDCLSLNVSSKTPFEFQFQDYRDKFFLKKNFNQVFQLILKNQIMEEDSSSNFESDKKVEASSSSKSKVKVKSNQIPNYSRSMYRDGFEERHDLEQYFWTDKTIKGILDALRHTFGPDESCCLCTPSLADTWWWDEGGAVNLLDIDTRFKYLPKFRYFDLRTPEDTQLGPDQDFWRIIIFDPPFFYIPMEVLYKAVLHVCDNKIGKTKLLLGFLKREEKILLETFKEFNLKRTSFPLEYAHVKSNKWVNYALYSNVDLPGIKRLNK